VLLLHAGAIGILLFAGRVFFAPAAKNPRAITWILLPPEAAPVDVPKAMSPIPPIASRMAPLFENTSPIASPQPVITPLQLVPPTFTLPPLQAPASPEKPVFFILGDYFSCNFVRYDEVPEADRGRCALRLSKLGDVTALSLGYTDNKETPFSIFGWNGRFALTAPNQRSFDIVEAATGCRWEQGVCRPPEPPKFGFDPDDPTRGTAMAKFELAKGLSLNVGAQGYMENYLGGARLIYVAGVVLTYRW
jgi:hypothetical protein